MVIKIIYIISIVLYVGIIGIWCYRFPISYKIVGGNPNLIENRDLTNEEYDRIKSSYFVRQKISNILVFCSVLLCIGSYIIKRNHWFEPVIIIKVVMIVAAIIALILILINGIHFIPGPPIR